MCPINRAESAWSRENRQMADREQKLSQKTHSTICPKHEKQGTVRNPKSSGWQKVSIRWKSLCCGQFRQFGKNCVWWTISTIWPKSLCGGHFGRKNTFDHLPGVSTFCEIFGEIEKAVSLIGLFPLLLCRADEIKLEGDYRGWKKTSFFLRIWLSLSPIQGVQKTLLIYPIWKSMQNHRFLYKICRFWVISPFGTNSNLRFANKFTYFYRSAQHEGKIW